MTPATKGHQHRHSHAASRSRLQPAVDARFQSFKVVVRHRMIPWRVRAHSADDMSADGRVGVARATAAKFADDCVHSERPVRARDRRYRFEDLIPGRHALRMVVLMPLNQGHPVESSGYVTLMPLSIQNDPAVNASHRFLWPRREPLAVLLCTLCPIDDRMLRRALTE